MLNLQVVFGETKAYPVRAGASYTGKKLSSLSQTGVCVLWFLWISQTKRLEVMPPSTVTGGKIYNTLSGADSETFNILNKFSESLDFKWIEVFCYFPGGKISFRLQYKPLFNLHKF